MLEYDLIRVDDRLIHGQVLIKWMKMLDVQKVWVLSDELNDDPILKTFMMQTIPPMYELSIWDLHAGVEHMFEAEGKALILLPDIRSLFFLFETGIRLKNVIIARLPYAKGKQKLCDHMFVSSEERKQIGILLNQGVSIRIQMVPDSDAKDLGELM